MKAKDKVALETLRNVKKVFLEAKTAPGANDTLTDADALKIIQKLTKQGQRCRRDLCATGTSGPCRRRIGASKGNGSISAQTNVSRRIGSRSEGNHRRSRRYRCKDMGKVMGVASKKLAGLAEGRAISAKVKELLG